MCIHVGLSSADMLGRLCRCHFLIRRGCHHVGLEFLYGVARAWIVWYEWAYLCGRVVRLIASNGEGLSEELQDRQQRDRKDQCV